MQYAELVDVYEELAATQATLEKRDALAAAFADADAETLRRLVTLVRGKVFAGWESADLGVSTSLATEAVVSATGIDAERVRAWYREEGDLGDAAAEAVANRTQQTLFSDDLTVANVHETIQEVATYEGEGSQSRRVDAIAGLLSDAEPREARYVVRTVTGAMRLGVGEGLVRDALAEALLDGSEAAVTAVERGYEVTNDYRVVAERARDGGRTALADLDVELFRPIKPMLAGKAESLADAVESLTNDDGDVLFETKYDGIRAKLHGDDGEFRLFTRRLEDVTEQFPDVERAVGDCVDADRFILEAELVGYDPDTGDPVPFQQLSRRVTRTEDIEATAEEIPVTAYLFDAVALDGESLLETPLEKRVSALESVLSPDPPRIERAANRRVAGVDAAETFYETALEAGHEGVMAKRLDAAYQPGSRVGYQLKVKPTMEPLDVVVPRAKWSEGRKSDFLGRPFLAVRDEASGEFAEIGRMHTGFTDEEAAELTELLEPLIQGVEGREADLKPEVVLEVAYEEIQESPTYDSGYALRFPRFERIRHDLDPADVDTLDRVERLYEQQ
ncbi:MAG: ATP-dependent DNA ligase [Halolamina sp.]